jgi:hypothetical protein
MTFQLVAQCLNHYATKCPRFLAVIVPYLQQIVIKTSDVAKWQRAHLEQLLTVSKKHSASSLKMEAAYSSEAVAAITEVHNLNNTHNKRTG